MARITPEWLALLQGKKIQYTGADVTQRKYLNFTGDVSLTDDALNDRTNVDLELNVSLGQVLSAVTPLIVSKTLGTDIIDPGNPLTGIRLFSSGGYAHVRDSHSGLATIVAVPRMTLSDHDQTVSVNDANDFWLYSGTLSANRIYHLTSSGATAKAAVTFELLDPAGYTVQIMNNCFSASLLFTKPINTPVVVDCVYDGSDFRLVGWKYRTH